MGWIFARCQAEVGVVLPYALTTIRQKAKVVVVLPDDAQGKSGCSCARLIPLPNRHSGTG
jgi:hypothetical protein